MALKLLTLLSAAALLEPWAAAQLSGSVGPTTSRDSKSSTKVCNIMDYGGKNSATTDNSAAITAAWNDCASGGEVYIPSGSYGLSNWITLSHGSHISINLEGVIYRTGSASGNMIFIEQTTDFEFYSANSKGAIQGYGYQFHQREYSSLVPRTPTDFFSFQGNLLTGQISRGPIRVC